MLTSLELLDPRGLLSGKTLEFAWKQEGKPRNTRIAFPELIHNPLRTWGDWGPMHSIRLRPHQQILVFTRLDEGNIEQVSHLMPAQLLLESPMLASEREECPLVLTIEDQWRGFRYRLGLDHAGDVSSVEVQQTGVKARQQRVLYPVAAGHHNDRKREAQT